MSAPAYSLSPLEIRYYSQLYGSVGGTAQGASADSVVNLFAKSSPRLSHEVLGTIWSLADYEEAGSLTTQGFEIACRLIGHAQAGTTVTKDLINRPGPVPKFDGTTVPVLAPQTTGSRVSFSPLPPSASAARVAPADREKFVRMFNAQGPVNGLIGGDKAGALFLKSNLPNTTLAQIWKLSDTKERGELDATEFVIGMHLIQKIMSGAMTAPLPDTLPPGLYESASGAGAAPALPPLASNIPRQVTGQQTPASPMQQQQYASPQPPAALPFAGAARSAGWSITPAEKQQSDSWFDGLQKNPQGLLEGPQAVEFFMKSTLDQTTLATIWDLCDMRNAGNLNKDEFAVATRLINDQLDGKPLPAKLPADLIPPSLQGGAAPVPQKSAVEHDLFSLLDDEQSPTSAVATPSPAPARTLTSPPPSRLGVSSPVPTAARVASPPAAVPAPSFARSPDIMSADDGPSAAVSASSAEVGNLRAQLASTTSSLEKTRGERAQIETAVNTSSSDLAALQAQLEAARTAYTTESSLLSSLQTRAANQTSELAELRSKLITAESDLSGLRVERAEVEQSVLRDKEDIRMLKAKIVEVDRETEKLKSEAEAKKKEAKQQRGMGAITKKQLERSEEKRNAARSELEAASVPEPQPVESIVSPAASVRSTNPFERMQGQGAVLEPQLTGASSRALSPQPTGSRQAPPVPPSRRGTVATDATTMGTLAAAGIGAVAAGAVTAATFAAEGAKNLVGAGGDAHKVEEQKPAVSTGAADEELGADSRFPDIEASAPPATSNGFDDAFGISSAPSTSISAAPSGFDDAFGVSSAAPSTSAVGFDDAFAEPAASTSAAKEVDAAFEKAAVDDKPAVAPTSNGFEDAFDAPPPKTTETGAAAFDDAFSEHKAPVQPAGLTNETIRHNEDDSSDEEGPEPAEGYGYGQSRSVASQSTTSPFEEVTAPPSMPGGFASTSSAGGARPASIASSGGDTFEDARQHVVDSPAHAQPPAFQPVGAIATQQKPADDFDDFEREFDDLPAATHANDASTLKASHPADTSTGFDDDAFSQEFDRLDDFAPAPITSSSIPTSGSAAFDAAFAGFDSPVGTAAGSDGGFGAAFDDSFGAPTSAPAPYAPPLPMRGTSVASTGATAKEDDAPDVKQVVALGFTRQQAITALEKHSYNVQAAINSLLDSAP